MTQPALTITTLTLNLSDIARVLHLSETDVETAFRDGRGAWPFSEYWGARLYQFVKHGNSNQPISDGAVVLGQLGDARISVKALTRNGIKFQQSKFVGFGRKGDKADLIASLEGCDRVVVVDVSGFPKVRMIPVDSTRLLSAAHQGHLKNAGWPRDRFYRWLEETYEVAEAEVSF